MASSAEDFKRAAAARALDFVEPGQRLGLGTGSTAAQFVDLLGDRVRHGLDIVCVPTSEATRAQAERLGIPLTTLDEEPRLDLTVDGADEIGPGLALIKGGGGALLREKIVATASARLLIIADASKRVEVLGGFPLPVEVAHFGTRATTVSIEECARALGLGGPVIQRMAKSGEPFPTDNGNLIFDCHFHRIEDPARLAGALAAIPGVVEHGLFIDMADIAVIADADGVTVIEA
ncbi:MAG: ribose-5-phosphate isomerase RpiA [Hyphomicrobiales bacterium]|nr:ribose-5-phosphate isomerase RpiA [Hyphomicrobiales bacterium]